MTLSVFMLQGLYDLHIQMMGIPLLPWEPPEMSYDITAKQVMNKQVVALKTFERVTNVLDILQDRSRLHSGFPVVDAHSTRKSVTSAPEIRLESNENGLVGKSVVHQLEANFVENSKAREIEMNAIEEV